MNLAILLLLSLVTLSARAIEPRCPAPGMLSGINFQTEVTAEWQGNVASPEFPAETRAYYENFLRSIFAILEASPLAEDSPFLGRKGAAKPLPLHIVLTDGDAVTLFHQRSNFEAAKIAFDGSPITSSFHPGLARLGEPARLYLVFYTHHLFLDLPRYSPKENLFLRTMVNLPHQFFGFAEMFKAGAPLPKLSASKSHAQRRDRHFFRWLIGSDIFKKFPSEIQSSIEFFSKKAPDYSSATCALSVGQQPK